MSIAINADAQRFIPISCGESISGGWMVLVKKAYKMPKNFYQYLIKKGYAPAEAKRIAEPCSIIFFPKYEPVKPFKLYKGNGVYENIVQDTTPIGTSRNHGEVVFLNSFRIPTEEETIKVYHKNSEYWARLKNEESTLIRTEIDWSEEGGPKKLYNVNLPLKYVKTAKGWVPEMVEQLSQDAPNKTDFTQLKERLEGEKITIESSGSVSPVYAKMETGPLGSNQYLPYKEKPSLPVSLLTDPAMVIFPDGSKMPKDKYDFMLKQLEELKKSHLQFAGR